MKKLLILPILMAGLVFCQNGTLPEEPETPEDPKQESGDVLGKVYNFFPESGSSVNALWIDNGYLFAGDDGHVHIYSLADPMQPKEVAKVSLIGKVRQLSVNNNRLYVASREAGSFIVDISDISNPKFLCRYDCSELATGVDASGNVMFLGHRNNGVEFVDVSDPEHPAHIDLIKTPESQSVFYQDGYLYSGEWAKGQVTVFDVRDISNIQIVSTIDLQGYGDGIWAKGNRLYASTGHHHVNSAKKTQDGDGHGMEIWDITNPSSPTFISRVEFDIFYKSGTDYWFPRPSEDGKTVFCSDVFNGAYVVDTKNEKNPKVIAHFESESKNAVTSVAVGDGVVYFSAGKDGIYAVECSRAKTASRLGTVEPTGQSFRRKYSHPSSSKFYCWQDPDRGQIHAADGYGEAIYVACGDAGMSVLKQKADGSLYRIAKGPSKFAGDLKVKGDKLYVAEGLDGIAVYNIAPDYSLSLQTRISGSKLGPYSSSRACFWIMVPNDKYILCGNRVRGYMPLYNQGTEDAPDYKYTTNVNIYVGYNKYVSDKVCGGNLLPYFTRNSSAWIDLSSNTVPAPSAIDKSKLATSISGGVTDFKDGNALYVQDKMLKIARAGAQECAWASPSNNEFVGVPRWDGADRLVLCATIEKHVRIIELSSYSSSDLSFTPKVSISEDTNGRPEAAAFWKGKALVPCGYQGLLLEK